MDLPVDISFDGDLSGPLVSTQPEPCSREDLKSTKIPLDLSPIEAPNLSPFRSPIEQLTKRNVKNEKPISAKKLFSSEKNDRESSLGVTPLNNEDKSAEDNQSAEPNESKTNKTNNNESNKKRQKIMKNRKESHKFSFGPGIKGISLVRPFAQFAKKQESDQNENFDLDTDLKKTEEATTLECEEDLDERESTESSSQRYEVYTEKDSLETEKDSPFSIFKDEEDEDDKETEENNESLANEEELQEKLVNKEDNETLKETVEASNENLSQNEKSCSDETFKVFENIFPETSIDNKKRKSCTEDEVNDSKRVKTATSEDGL